MPPSEPLPEDLKAFLQRVERPSTFRALAPGLHIGGPPGPAWTPDTALPALRSGGYVRVPHLVPRARARALSEAIEALVAARLHPVFVLVFDELWELAFALRAAMAGIVGGPVALEADVWAFFVPPRPEAAGWKPHRGVYEASRGAAPDTVTAWISLSDAPLDGACMHVVPAADDPHHPAALTNVSVPEAAYRPLPTSPGDVLAWDACLLHHGGRMGPDRTTPRTSVAFNFVRVEDGTGDAPAAAFAREVIEPAAVRTFGGRLDVVAEQVAMYESEVPRDADTRPFLAWAALWRALHERRSAVASGAAGGPADG